MSVLLVAALVVMSMPMTRAAQEVTLQASGVVQQSVPANEDLNVTLASVHEGTYATRSATNDWTGPAPALNGNLTLFSGLTNLRPGATNGAKGSTPADRYKFVLVNEYEKPIEYTYTHGATAGSAAVPMGYTLFRNGVLTPVPAGGLEGTVPVDGYVEFELEWLWDYYKDVSQDLADTDLGVAAAAALTEYEALLKFEIEADEPASVSRTVTLIWKDSVTGEVYATWMVEPGMTVTQAMAAYGYGYPVNPRPEKTGYTFLGFKDQNDVTITGDYVIAANTQGTATVIVEGTWKEEWPGLLLPGILGAGGLTIGGLTIPWLLSIPALSVIGAVGWLLHHNCKTDCGKPGCPCEKPAASEYVPPPKTGDSWNAVLLAGMGMALAAGVMTIMLRRKKEKTTFSE